MKITILGEYITKFGELWDKSLRDLLNEAIVGALRNSRTNREEIEAVFVGNMGSGVIENQLHLGALASSMFPHYPVGVTIEGACASGGVAMVAAEQGLLSGAYKTVMVVGVEKMTDISGREITEFLSGAADMERERDCTFPALNALLMRAHMEKYGTEREMLSAVSCKNHLHAMSNEEAQFHKKISVAEVNNSELVADPIRLLDCSPVSDGAAAVVMTTRKRKGPKILGYGQGGDSLTLADRGSLFELEATETAARKCYKMAGLAPNDVQVAEVHDAFTIHEIMAIEDLGFFGMGEGGGATLSGMTTYGGKIVINPSGGLKACGHPVGATGVRQIAYLSRVIRSNKFKIGLSQNIGGSGATVVVHIIGGDK